MRIDAHIHYTPPALGATLPNFAEQEPFSGLLFTPDPVNHTEQGWATIERTIADMDAAGLDRVTLLRGGWDHENCVARNSEMMVLMRRYPERLIVFASIQPRAGNAAIQELERCLDAGMLGVGELNPYGQGYSLEDSDLLRLVEACIRHDVPINMHVSEPVGHFYLGKTTTPLLSYYHLARRYPELKLILAHWGGGLLFYELMPEVRSELANVYYDMAASPLLFPTEQVVPAALQCVSPHKILYGSDYPLLICPQQQHEPDFRPFIAEIDALGLSPEIYAAIMGGNAGRLLGLDAGAAPDILAHQVVVALPAAEEAQISKQLAIEPYTSVRLVATRWPETRAVFEQFGIPWHDSPVPFWEPIAQAAAAHGLGPEARRRLIADLNEAISGR